MSIATARWAIGLALTLVAPEAAPKAQVSPAASSVRYRVNYRPGASDTWQLYTETRAISKANTIADEMRQAGYQVQVVDNTAPVAQFYPDAADTSASGYYPTSNYAADYNTYVVPGGGNGYGWYGGWYPWYRHRVYPNYWWNGGSYWHSGGWGAHNWSHGWNHSYHWGDHWNHSHRNWNHSHADRGSHHTHSEHHAAAAHHGYAGHRATAGHHTAGHHAAAAHANQHSADHRGTGHAGHAGRTGGSGRGAAHAAAGHARGGGGHGTAGRHAGGMHAAHMDP